MKKLSPFLLVILLFLYGCATNSYKTLDAVGHGVDSSYKAYLDLVIKGAVRTNGVPHISAEYKTFQVLYGEALTVAQFNPKQVPGTNITVQAAQIITDIAVEKGSK